MTLFKTRPRRLAVALFALGGALVAGLGGAVMPVQAAPGDTCTSVTVWIYENQQGREYKVGPEECIGPWERNQKIGWGDETDTGQLPPGTPTGAGFYVWVPF